MSILAGAETRILVQGITGREAATFTLESLRYGARIVAGVTPGKGGQYVHAVPVFDTVAQALRAQPCEAAIVSVPAPYVRDAALEAFANDIKLVVILTERVARRDVVGLLEQARAVGARVVGPNSLGVISPELTRIGMCGGSADAVRRAYRPGPVGVMSRSGGMLTEIASLLSQDGLGQSTCVSIGGDAIVGSAFLDLLPLYEADPQTRALVCFCEPGGTLEERLAAHLQAHPSRLPLIAFVAGRFTDQIQGQRFGHAGAIVEGSSGSPASKIAALRGAGVRVADKLSQIPGLVREALGD
ncbi:MAG: succinate--CoA ligase subunit alpha [Anaerolineales bacterium]